MFPNSKNSTKSRFDPRRLFLIGRATKPMRHPLVEPVLMALPFVLILLMVAALFGLGFML